MCILDARARIVSWHQQGAVADDPPTRALRLGSRSRCTARASHAQVLAPLPSAAGARSGLRAPGGLVAFKGAPSSGAGCGCSQRPRPRLLCRGGRAVDGCSPAVRGSAPRHRRTADRQSRMRLVASFGLMRVEPPTRRYGRSGRFGRDKGPTASKIPLPEMSAHLWTTSPLTIIARP